MPGKPKNQFSRPSIDLGGAKKAWQELAAQDIEVGDLIKPYGLVTDFGMMDFKDRWVSFQMASGDHVRLGFSDVVEVFAKVRSA
jgi:hypothetical protein